jgi:peptide/nickel transport system substrate-binding protein
MRKSNKLLLVALVVMAICIPLFAQGAKDPAPKATIAADGNIVRGGTLVAGKTNKWSTLVPTRSTSRGDDRYITSQIFDTLVSMDESGNFVPQLAESWEMQEKAMVMKLRNDVLFHDGTPLNAEAVKFIFDWYFGPVAKPIFISEINAIQSVDVVDEFTVRFNLKEPSAILLSALSNNAGMMMSPAAIKQYGDDIVLHPVGTGPFKMKEAIEGDHITLVRNENYYLKGKDGLPLPYLDVVVIRVITDEPVKVTNLQSGDINITDYLNAATSLDTLKTNKNVEVIRTTAGDHFALYPNHLHAPLGDARVRQAISLALDKQAICDALTRGYGTVAPFPVSPGQWFYSSYDPFKYDPAKAKQLLTEAGFPNGFTVKLQNIAREPDNTIVQAVQSQLKKVGINVEIESIERNAWVALFARNSDKGELAFGRWTFPRVDAYMQIYNNLGASAIGNYSNYNNTKFNELLEKTKSVYDVTERKALFAEIQKIVLDDAANIWIYQMPRHIARNVKVQNLKTDQEGIWILRDVWMTK